MDAEKYLQIIIAVVLVFVLLAVTDCYADNKKLQHACMQRGGQLRSEGGDYLACYKIERKVTLIDSVTIK